MNALLVGQRFFDDQTLAIQLRGWGFRCDFASNKRDARRILKSNRFDLLLSQASLPDGTGFGLTKALKGRPVTAFICLELDDSCLWMPATENGRECLGKAALSTEEFTRILEELSWSLVAPSSAKPPNRELQESPSPQHRSHGRGKRERSDKHSPSLVLAGDISRRK
jgi:hypothetical protein